VKIHIVPHFFLLLILICLAAAWASSPADNTMSRRINEETEKNMPEVIKIRRFLHMNPEPANREFETSRLIASKLESLGLEVRTGIAKTGIVALLKGAQPGPAVAVRAEMDALPIQEKTNLAYSSLNPGLMHACGHDVHCSLALGTAMVLAPLKDRIKGNIVFIFQPAEEGPPANEEGGARLMIKEGAIANPGVSAIFALQVWPETVGKILFSPGTVTASSDPFKVTIKGRSADAARPHEGVDAIVIAAEIITALQAVPSRELDPTDPAVITIGVINGGTKSNMIAEEVTFGGTVLSLSHDNRKKIPIVMESIVDNIAASFGASAVFEYKRGIPSVYNHPELAASMLPTLEKLLGKDKVLPWKPQMMAEDFALFSEKIPAFYFFLGVKNPAQPAAAPLHSPHFNPDEAAIPIGIKALCHLLLDALAQQSF